MAVLDSMLALFTSRAASPAKGPSSATAASAASAAEAGGFHGDRLQERLRLLSPQTVPAPAPPTFRRVPLLAVGPTGSRQPASDEEQDFIKSHIAKLFNAPEHVRIGVGALALGVLLVMTLTIATALHMRSHPGPPPPPPAPAGSFEESSSFAEVGALPEGWRTATDPATGQIYYYNSATGQSMWTRPGMQLQVNTANPFDQTIPGGCPGSIDFAGVGTVAVKNAKWNLPGDPAGHTDVTGGQVVTHMKGRAYFATSCQIGAFDYNQYLRLQLLGRTLRYTTDLSGALCGCNAALYLTSMGQHATPTACEDFYCDASNVCSASCTEVDVQEANSRAWFSTLHMAGDSVGLGGGYGLGRADWDGSMYGPGSQCIDTGRPFQVAVSFPVGSDGMLAAMKLVLTQEGSACSVSSTVNAADYTVGLRGGVQELTAALSQGMTPIISYWEQAGIEGMEWMDGVDKKGRGPCPTSSAALCSDSVRFWGFSVEDTA